MYQKVKEEVYVIRDESVIQKSLRCIPNTLYRRPDCKIKC